MATIIELCHVRPSDKYQSSYFVGQKHFQCLGPLLLNIFIGALIGWDIQPLNAEEIALRNTMISAWTNFAKFGDPTPPDSGLTPWAPIYADIEPQYWNIFGPEPVMDMSSYIKERMTKWEEVLGVSKTISPTSKFNQVDGNNLNRLS